MPHHPRRGEPFASGRYGDDYEPNGTYGIFASDYVVENVFTKVVKIIRSYTVVTNNIV